MKRFISALFFGFLFSATAALACAPSAYNGRALSQDWNEADRATWYGLSQGSRLIPMAWYDALRLKDSDTYFAARAVQERYASVFCDGSDLPLGFVVDRAEDRVDALGLTCSACHTGVLDDGIQSFVVEGGASDLDLQSYMADMFAGLVDVYRDAGPEAGAKWQAFAGGVLGDGYTGEQGAQLEADLRDWLQRRHQIQKSIEDGGAWGHGRTDAVAVILNTATVLSGQRAGVTLPIASAPVSYPHVWNAPQMRRVQWNGSATKIKDIGLIDTIEMGAVTRNIAEVLGVFGEIELTVDRLNDTARYPSLKSSIKLANLVKLERSMETLKSPAWPDAWGAVDRGSALYQKGAALYEGQCASCHSVLDRDDLSIQVGDAELGAVVNGPVTRMVPAFDVTDLSAKGHGTDPMMVCNVLTHTSWTGKFEQLHNTFGSFRRLVGDKDISALSPDKFEKGTLTLRLIEELALRMTYEKRGELMALQSRDLDARAASFFTGLKEGIFGTDPGRAVDPASIGDRPVDGTHDLQTLEAVKERCAEFVAEQAQSGQSADLPAYKARPLNGIFASPPFLHNGSVPSIHDLLLPAAQRPVEFAVGRVRYDPARMGTAEPLGDGPVSTFRVLNDAGGVVMGNSNAGHEYAASLECATAPDSAVCAADRLALMEYLKGL